MTAKRPRLLDLYCGAGGCSVGYARAGFDVEGVDITYHADYPYEQWTGDVFDFLAEEFPFREFDVVHASPPCMRWSSITRNPYAHPDLITPTRKVLEEWAADTGGLWVLENVVGSPLSADGLTLCGPALGLPLIRRHRLFSSNVFLMGNGCACSNDQPTGVYGNFDAFGGDRRRPGDGTSRGRKASGVEEAGAAMGIDWMTEWDDLTDAIPPNYTEFIGEQLLDHLARVS